MIGLFQINNDAWICVVHRNRLGLDRCNLWLILRRNDQITVGDHPFSTHAEIPKNVSTYCCFQSFVLHFVIIKMGYVLLHLNALWNRRVSEGIFLKYDPLILENTVFKNHTLNRKNLLKVRNMLLNVIFLNLDRFLRAGILQIFHVELVVQIIHVSHLFIICSVKQILQSLYSSETVLLFFQFLWL